VYVGNITASITEETLLALFAHCGQVTNVRISGYVPNPSSALAGDGRGRCST
jgi:RNA recognition motif-containing protein